MGVGCKENKGLEIHTHTVLHGSNVLPATTTMQQKANKIKYILVHIRCPCKPVVHDYLEVTPTVLLTGTFF